MMENSEDYVKHLNDAREDATAIANAAMTFMMSRAEMVQCSPVMCLLVLQILTERNLEGHIELSAKAACRMSKSNLNPAVVEKDMRDIIEGAMKHLRAGFKSKLVSLNDDTS